MISIYFESKYKVNSKKIISEVRKILKENHVVNAKLSVVIGTRYYIAELAKKYLNETKEEAWEHPVLSFSSAEIEGDYVMHPDEKKYLGEIIVSYQKAIEASKINKTNIDKEISDLACHGALHLIGVHHE